MTRLFACAALAAALSLPAAAQPDGLTSAAVPCVSGTAGSYACSGIDLLARLPLAAMATPGSPAPVSAAEIWGWTDPETGREIALVSVSNGLAFVDVTAPEAPVLLGKLPSARVVDGTCGGAGQASCDNTWRTARTYANHVYVASETSNHGVQVFDLTRLRGVTTPTTFTETARYRGVSNVHTLEISQGTGTLVLAGSTRSGASTECTAGGLHLVSLANPAAPAYAGCFAADGYTHEAQCLVYDGPDTRYTGRDLCFAYNEDSLTLVDITNRAAPALVSRSFYPDAGYTHQGWLTADKRFVLINDEFDSAQPGTRTIVMNVEDLTQPEFAFNYVGPKGTYAHNLYIIGRYGYLSNYESGTAIVDLQRIGEGIITQVAAFDTYPQRDGRAYNGQWMNYPFFASGNVVAADIQNGLFVLRPQGLLVDSTPAPAPVAAAELSAPQPNPTADVARLTLRVPEAARVRATLVDATGREVAVLFEGVASAELGTEIAVGGRALPAGTYVVRVVGPGVDLSRPVTVAR